MHKIRTIVILSLLSAYPLTGMAQVDQERNVMLNAQDATKPREIQIGLPSEDVDVYENGLPAVYSGNVHRLNAHWRNGLSQSGMTLLDPSESAISTGNIAYSVSSESRWGDDQTVGMIDYHANHFGLHNIDLNLSGRLGKGCNYSASMYQMFDPGTFDLKYDALQDRTQIYQLGLSRQWAEGRGSLKVQYKYAASRQSGKDLGVAPFIYNGDGSVSEVNGFAIGTTSYGPRTGRFEYMDMLTGERCTTDLQDESDNRSHELTLLLDYRAHNDWQWSIKAKYMNAPVANYVDFGGCTIAQASKDDGLTDEVGRSYEGLVDCRRTWLHFGKVQNLLSAIDVTRAWANNRLHIGVSEWYYDLDYHSSNLSWMGSVEANPQILTQSDGTRFFGWNALGAEYAVGSENKLAIYTTDQWQISPRINLMLGGRAEWFRMAVNQMSQERFDGFYIGARDTDGTLIAPGHIVKDKLNFAATAQIKVRMVGALHAMADITTATRHPRIIEYACTGPTDEQYQRALTLLSRAGVYYQNPWIDITSMVTLISRSNNIEQQQLTRPGTVESKTVLLIYDIRTLGWTTSAEIKPYHGVKLHTLLTLQRPEYKHYDASVTFSDGSVGSVNANGNTVAGIPQVLVELDPSYTFDKPNLRLWMSFRYFGKTYANIQEALYFKGHWETFAGMEWRVSDKLTLGCDVVNLLNQTGAQGTIEGTQLVTPSEASQYAGTCMSGPCLRPFTVEFSAGIRF